MTQRHFIFDYDSTFIQAESFDELIRYVLRNQSNQESLLDEIERLTELSMNGQFSFHESLDMRLKGIRVTRNDIDKVAQSLKNKISPSFLRHKSFFEQYRDSIYVFSGGFIELIWPVIKSFGIPYDKIYANQFLYNHEGEVVDYDRLNPLCQDRGKVQLLQQLDLPGDIVVVGDGYNDYEMKDAGLAHTFFAYTETVSRDNVIKNADGVINNLEGLFLSCNLEVEPSPKPKKALLLENLHPFVSDYLKSHNFEVTTIPKALPEEELAKALEDVAVLGIRSKTQISSKLLEHANALESIGAFCIGTNQIDVQACLKKGISVFNAPFSNTRSVVELTLAHIIMLFRRLAEQNSYMHQGVWEKTSAQCREVRGKTLGIIGYGNIGSQLSVLAENLGMQILYYDIEEKMPLGNAKATESMADLLAQSDVVSLHVDGRASNHNLIDHAALRCMKPQSYLINLSRGFVVDLDALKEALDDKHVLGAALDVFPQEPSRNQSNFFVPLADYPQVILSPHIGGSTLEAQENIGQFVANRLQEYSQLGATMNSVNFPQLQLPSIQGSHRIIHIHDNVPGILAKINSLLAEHNVNIEGQYLKTNESIGYVITDVNALNGDGFIQDLSAIDHTIKVRILY